MPETLSVYGVFLDSRRGGFTKRNTTAPGCFSVNASGRRGASLNVNRLHAEP